MEAKPASSSDARFQHQQLPASDQTEGGAWRIARDLRQDFAVNGQLSAVRSDCGGSVEKASGLEVDHGPLAVLAVGEVDLARREGAVGHGDGEGELAVDEVGGLRGGDLREGAGAGDQGGGGLGVFPEQAELGGEGLGDRVQVCVACLGVGEQGVDQFPEAGGSRGGVFGGWRLSVEG